MSTLEVGIERARARRILWAEDHPGYIRGTFDQIRHRRHEIVEVTSFEESADALRSDAFDLFVVDQQLPRHGRQEYHAGSQLVAALKRGEFGDVNIEVPFVFVTASADWVYDSKIDVVKLPGFMSIEEKGGALASWFERELEGIPRNPNRATGSAADAPVVAEPPEALREATVDRGAVLRHESWEGIVTGIDDTHVSVSLADSDGVRPDHEARLPREMVSPRDEEWLVEGAELVWRVRLLEDESGKRTTVSDLEFHRPAAVSAEEIAQALARAQARRALDDFPEA
jgi:CheY-like chemotaxis protein